MCTLTEQKAICLNLELVMVWQKSCSFKTVKFSQNYYSSMQCSTQILMAKNQHRLKE